MRQVNSIDSQISQMPEVRIARLEEENEDLRAEVERLTRERDEARDAQVDCVKLGRFIGDFVDSPNYRASERASRDAEVAALHREVVDLMLERDEARAEVERLKGQLADARAEIERLRAPVHDPSTCSVCQGTRDA